MSKRLPVHAGLFSSQSTEKLRLLDLPVFYDEVTLASLIQIESEIIKKIVDNPNGYYNHFYISKKSGGKRKINQPSKELKAIQAWILRFILSKLSPSAFATAYRRNTNVLDNVRPHSGNRHFLVVDIKNFFGNINASQIERLYRTIGYRAEQSNILVALTTHLNSIPQGAVTSPALSNLVCHHMDRRLAAFAAHRSAVYTRYADDIVLSSNNRINLSRSLPKVKSIIEGHGFKLNNQKTRLLGPSAQCKITGLVKHSSKPQFAVGRRDKRKARTSMHALATKSPQSQWLTSSASVFGWLNYVRSVDSIAYGQMSRYWNGLVDKYGSGNSELVKVDIKDS